MATTSPMHLGVILLMALGSLLFHCHSVIGRHLQEDRSSRVSYQNRSSSTLGREVSSNEANEISLPELKKIQLSQRRFRFLHMGKTGGGTIAQRLRGKWRVGMKQCHPWPCHPPNMQKNHPHFLISLRDPVDRFVSAFYWRVLRICHPQVERRTQNTSSKCLSDDPEYVGRPETKILFYRYHQNASLLAQDLCSENSTKAQIANESIKEILHAQHSIRDWLDFPWDAKRVYPLIAEAGAQDLEEQLDETMHLLFNITQFVPADAFPPRAALAKARKHLAGHEKNDHSSVSAKIPLTEAAERCLERYYHDDYKLLQEIQHSACRIQGCREAIRRILDRRERAFQR